MFDKDLFADLLKKLKGERSINAYGRDSGVSAAYISKLLRGLYEKAPSPEILYRLADRPYIVSYADLMEAVGHILPLEESNKNRARSAYLLKDDPFYRNMHPDLDERFKILSEEDIRELDEFIKDSSMEDRIDFIQKLNDVTDLKKMMDGEKKALELAKKETPSNLTPISPATVKIPVLGRIACGDPIDVEENFNGYRYRSPDGLPSGKLYILEAVGDSMLPTIPHGAEVTIREQPEVENSEIAAVLVNGDEQVTLKRIRWQGNTMMLMPDNRDYEPIIVSEDYPVTIIGKAVEVVTKL